MADRKHCIRKTLRLTPKEAGHLARQAAQKGMSEAAYLRLLLSQRPADNPEVRVLLKKLINEVNHVGVNINQIAHKHNSGIYAKEDMETLTECMKKLVKKMEGVEKALGDQQAHALQ